MSVPVRVTKEITRGDAYTLELHFANDGTPADVSSWSAWSAMARETSDAPAHTDFAVDTSQAALGLVILTLTAVQTRALPSSVVKFDAEANVPGLGLTTVAAGELVVTDDAAHA